MEYWPPWEALAPLESIPLGFSEFPSPKIITNCYSSAWQGRVGGSKLSCQVLPGEKEAERKRRYKIHLSGAPVWYEGGRDKSERAFAVVFKSPENTAICQELTRQCCVCIKGLI